MRIGLGAALHITAACAVATPARAEASSGGSPADNNAPQTTSSLAEPRRVILTAEQLFAFADKSVEQENYSPAEAAYRALAGNPDTEIRSEARFRLAMMLADRLHRWRDAAILLRQILDEKPDAGRVRLELARMQAQMGHLGAAERELRAARATGLPVEVERMTRFYADALSALRPFGLNLQAAIAPDTNINRATRSNTLGTVIGDFSLNDSARARSGVGASVRGQAYLRRRIAAHGFLLVRLSTSADLYRQSDFDDVSVSLQAGPEWRRGKSAFGISAGPAWRWYGLKPFSVAATGSVWWQGQVTRRASLRIEGAAGHSDNRRNPLQSGDSYALSVALDRAFTARAGGGIQLSGSRETARDPGYALTGGAATAYVYREFGAATVVASLGYGHVEADERLFLYPKRRIDNRVTASLAGTFRQLRIGPIAPLVRLRWERNASSVEIWDYRRLSGEIGLTAAF